MSIFRRESLENLRARIDLVEVLSSHIEMKPAGASHKALCPFHDEKTPSFVVNRGDTHYHCFGCGAHGDAIQFLMAHLKMSFIEAVESLAQRFQIHLEQVEQTEGQAKVNTGRLKEALDTATKFYHFMLLHTEEGHLALHYLYKRGIDLTFIKQFQIGLAPAARGLFRKLMHEKKFSDQVMLDSGLLAKNQDGKLREFFSDRITFPIQNPSGATIGFSARKYKEDTFGGKYINTSETPLFKKSRTLFGLNFCRKRIAKERMAIIVEGQIDTLRMIHLGLNIVIAGQGTAFGENHAKELIRLGVNKIYLALDGDQAGQNAAIKIGDLFLKEGIAVFITPIPEGSDPDTYLQQEGVESFQKLLKKSEEYLPYLVTHLSKTINIDTPTGKNELVSRITQQIRRWDHPLVVHESLRKLAHLTQVPEEMIGVGQTQLPNVYIKKTGTIGHHQIDPDRIIECDLLRWLLLMSESHKDFVTISKENLREEHFQNTVCRKLFVTYLEHEQQEKSYDLLSLAISLDDTEGQLLMSELLQKRINKERSETEFPQTVQKILDRYWMRKREDIKMKIHSGKCSDEEVMELIKEFDHLKKNQPKVNLCPSNT